MSGEPKANVFDVAFEADGRNTAKYRNDVAVHMRGAAPVSVDLPTDEDALGVPLESAFEELVS